MLSLVVVHAEFEAHWPFVADDILGRWLTQGPAELIRLDREDKRVLREVYSNPERVTRLACLGVPATLVCLQTFSGLTEATFQAPYRGYQFPDNGEDYLRESGVRVYHHHSEGFWGQSVAEFALALTICGLRRITQNAHTMINSVEPWQQYAPERNQGPAQPGAQFSDDQRFTNGTISEKRVRVAGMGNIGSRYASFVKMLGANVAAWDPFASEPGFHRAGARRIWHLPELLKDAEIFAPMVPLTAQTRGLITAEYIDSLLRGCLVVLVTRAQVCDMAAIRRRVLANELALAADVFDVEPLPLDDPLLGRQNVVHTPHLAGRTRQANRQWVDDLLGQFDPSP